jgi:hypothetical protein
MATGDAAAGGMADADDGPALASGKRPRAQRFRHGIDAHLPMKYICMAGQ